MFVSDKLIYIQLQKTGSTHIAKLLSKIVNGQMKDSKHSRPKQALLESSRKLVSSIRNPWHWYVSLWTYGCDGHGGVRERINETKNAKLWESCYADPTNPDLFRNWLSMVYSANYGRDLGEGYGESPVYGIAGFYTFRYLKLCCRNTSALTKDQLNSMDGLQLFERNNCYITNWIRTESLERDFIDILISSGENLADDYEFLIHAQKKTNTSSRNLPTAFYYNEKTIKAVKENEAIIINKFGYTFPETRIDSV